MDDENTDQRLEHHRDPPQFMPLDELYEKTGVEYFPVSQLNGPKQQNVCSRSSLEVSFQLNADTYNVDGKLNKIRKERGYTYEDEVCENYSDLFFW